MTIKLLSFISMDTISISQLKRNPSEAIAKAIDYPIAVENRHNVKAYLIGKKLYEKIVAYLEDYMDKQAISDTDFSKGKDFEIVAKSLDL